jgi:hypothetical protein
MPPLWIYCPPTHFAMLRTSGGQKCIAGIGIFQHYSQCHTASPTGIAVHTGMPSGIAVITAPVHIYFSKFSEVFAG